MIRWYHSSAENALVGHLREWGHELSHCRQSPKWPDGFYLRVEDDVYILFELCSCWTAPVYWDGSRYQPMLDRFSELTGCEIWSENHAEWVLRDRDPKGRIWKQEWPHPLARFSWNSVWYLARSFAGTAPHPVCEKCHATTLAYWGKRKGQRDSSGVADSYRRRTHARCRRSIRAQAEVGEYGLFNKQKRWDHAKKEYKTGPIRVVIPSWFDWGLYQDKLRTEEHLRALRENKKLLAKARKALKGKYEHTTEHAGSEGETSSRQDIQERDDGGFLSGADLAVQVDCQKGSPDGP